MAKLKLQKEWMAPHKIVFPDGHSITLNKDELEVSGSEAIFAVKKYPELFAESKEEIPEVEKVAEPEAEQPAE